MNKEKNNLIKEYEKKIKLIKKYNRQYYEKTISIKIKKVTSFS